MRPEAERGFTLIEVLVAITILGIGLPIVFYSLSQSARTVGRLRDAYTRLEYARNLLADLDLIGPIRAGDSAEGHFPDGTRWNLESQLFLTQQDGAPEGASLVRITMTLTWNGRNGEQRWSMSTYRFSPRQINPTRSMEARFSEIR